MSATYGIVNSYTYEQLSLRSYNSIQQGADVIECSLNITSLGTLDIGNSRTVFATASFTGSSSIAIDNKVFKPYKKKTSCIVTINRRYFLKVEG